MRRREDGHRCTDFTGNLSDHFYEPDCDYFDGVLEDRNVVNAITT
jgi:hypothetical protein